MLTNLIGGFVVENFGWEIMFYAPAAVTLLWCVIWWLRVFESPEKHRSISDAELEYIVATRYFFKLKYIKYEPKGCKLHQFGCKTLNEVRQVTVFYYS